MDWQFPSPAHLPPLSRAHHPSGCSLQQPPLPPLLPPRPYQRMTEGVLPPSGLALQAPRSRLRRRKKYTGTGWQAQPLRRRFTHTKTNSDEEPPLEATAPLNGQALTEEAEAMRPHCARAAGAARGRPAAQAYNGGACPGVRLPRRRTWEDGRARTGKGKNA